MSGIQTNDDRIAERENNDEISHLFDRVNHPSIDGLLAVFRVKGLARGKRAYSLIMEDEIYTVVPSGHRCDCGENEEYTPSMGTPVKTAQRERQQHNCRHANIAMQCEEMGACDECGSWAFDTKQHTDRAGNVILEERYCSDCSNYIGC